MDALLLLPPLIVALLVAAAGGLECPPPGSCSRLRNHHVSCSGGLHQYARGGSHKARSLRLCWWPGAEFSPQEVLPLFPALTHLELVSGNVTNISSAFQELPRLQKLNMSRLMLEQLPPGTLERLTSLKELDLSDNRLSFLRGEVLEGLDQLRKVHLQGNPWNCSMDMTWLVDEDQDLEVVDREALVCSNDSFPGKPLAAIMAFTKEVNAQCPSPCSCWIGYVIRTSSDQLLPLVTVDCRHRGLVALPPRLPLNTSTLYAQGNQISDLTPLAEGAGNYGDVRDAYLDDNLVASVALLEGTPWLQTFRALSLRGNRLTQLPTYALQNALERNRNALSLQLGGNPWRCDCAFTPAFQTLLLRYARLVKDAREVRCAGQERRVAELSRSAVCREPQQLLSPLHLLNAALAALIALVLAKLAFDYWAFKRTGKLPWIVAKMP